MTVRTSTGARARQVSCPCGAGR